MVILDEDGGLGINFITSLFIKTMHYTPEINEYNVAYRNILYDYKTNKKIVYSKNKYVDWNPKNKKILLKIRNNVTRKFVHTLGFIKDNCGVKCRGNYKASKQSILDFNKKHGVYINPYSIVCVRYFKNFPQFDEEKFINLLREVYQNFLEDNHKKQNNKFDYIIYYEDLIINQQTENTMFEGYEKQIKEYHLKNVELIKNYSDLLNVPNDVLSIK